MWTKPTSTRVDEDNESGSPQAQIANLKRGAEELEEQVHVNNANLFQLILNEDLHLNKREESTAHNKSRGHPCLNSICELTREEARYTAAAKESIKIDKVEERAMSVNQLLDVVKIINERCHAEAWKDKDSKRLKPSTVTLYDLYKYVIFPNTTKDGCSYVEMIANDPQPADWFISHWWGESVIHFVSCVRQHAIDHCYSFGHKYYWVCAYANNQHDLKSANLDDPEKSSFMKAMKQANSKVLSIVDPNAVKYTRIWCGLEVFMGLYGRYEVYSVPDAGTCKAYDIDLYKNLLLHRDEGKTNIELWKDVEEQLKNSLQTRTAVGITVGLAENDGDGMLRFARIKAFREKCFPIEPLKKIMGVHIQECDATNPEDKTRILEYIRNKYSKSDEDVYEEFNNKLKGKMVASVWRVLLEDKDINQGDNMQKYAETLRKSGVKRMTLSMCGCDEFNDEALEVLANALPDKLERFELEASASKIEKGDYLLHKLVEETRSDSLQQLVMPNCKLSCDLPAMITKLTKLKRLRLECNSLTGCIPEDIGNCTELKDVYLFDNPELGGEIPTSIGKLIKLERFHIGHSNYGGEIPKEYGLCTSLETSFLGNNKFTGSLPPIGKLLKLRAIFFNDNQFEGQILPEIENCSSLEVLFLHSNMLKGPLPEQLSKCKKLHTLSLFDNENLDAKSFYDVLKKCKLRTLYIDKMQADEIDLYCEEENIQYTCKAHKEKDNEIGSDYASGNTLATHENLATSVNIFRPGDECASGFAWDLARTHLSELFNEF